MHRHEKSVRTFRKKTSFAWRGCNRWDRLPENWFRIMETVRPRVQPEYYTCNQSWNSNFYEWCWEEMKWNSSLFQKHFFLLPQSCKAFRTDWCFVIVQSGFLVQWFQTLSSDRCQKAWWRSGWNSPYQFQVVSFSLGSDLLMAWADVHCHHQNTVNS